MRITKAIIGLIIGVPIACCGVLMYYLKYTRDKETTKLKEELNISTIAIVNCFDDLRNHLTKGDNNAAQ